MNTVGIIAEYNPFHTGHHYQIAESRAQLGGDAAVVVAMSGNWVQGGAAAIADKWTRARLALMGGADLVLEVPTLWAVSSAESFALGGVSVLNAAGVVDHISFGSECGDSRALEDVARCLSSEEYARALQKRLGLGESYAVSRQRAVEELLGPERAAPLSTANNNLGIEYLRALRKLDSSIRPLTVRREGAGHNTTLPETEKPRFVSATQIRSTIFDHRWEALEAYLLPGEADILKETAIPTAESMDGFQRAVLARLRVMAPQDWTHLPDSGSAEGLPDRLTRAARQAGSLEEFYALAKTKRYTHARLRRLALWAFLGLQESDRPPLPPYLRVLGCSVRGRSLLKEMKVRATLPVLTKSAHVRTLSPECQKLFELESRCTDLYGLCLPKIPPCGREWTENPVILPR